MVSPLQGTTQTSRHRLVTVLVAIAATGVLAALAPVPVVLGLARLGGLATMGLGAWLTVGRVGSIDLSVAAAAGAGAVGAGVLAGEWGLHAIVVVPVAALAGALVGAAAGALAGHLGRWAGALATLALGAGAVALARSVEVVGGRSGYHAVPLLLGGDRTDLVAIGVIVALAWLVVDRVAAGRSAARAAVAVAAPPVATSFGRRPAADSALVGAVAGAVLAVGGLVGAAVSGSVTVDAHGPQLATGLILVAVLAEALDLVLPTGRVLGHRRARGAALAILAVFVLHGPGTIFPLVPLVGTAPMLLVMGPVGLGMVMLAHGGRRQGSTSVDEELLARVLLAAPPMPPVRVAGDEADAVLAGTGLAIPGGALDVSVAAGQVVALVGPNGAGKSTILARLAGQLPDGGGTRFLGEVAPVGARRRARAGLARGWQRAPDVRAEDLLLAAGVPAVPGTAAVGPGVERLLAAAVLASIASRRPSVVLLDEPAALLPAPLVAAWLRSLADAGVAVLVVEHRPEVIATADRLIEVTP